MQTEQQENVLAYESTCDDAICENRELPEVFDILVECACAPYTGTNLNINPAAPGPTDILFDEPIMKWKSLTLFDNAFIQWDLTKDNGTYCLIVDELIVKRADRTVPTLDFRWFFRDYNAYMRSLQGATGGNAPAPSGKGAHGRTGGTGGTGGTRHSPTFFVFIKKMTVENGDPNEVNFEFDLPGLPGGNGGRGGDGSDGNDGKRGKSARSEGPFCRRNNGYGGAGGNAGRGGKGGNAGCSGDGASLFFYVGENKIWDAIERSRFRLKGGETNPEQGVGGRPGQAGRPGKTGPVGSRDGNCGEPRRYFDTKPGKPEFGTPAWRNHNMGRGVDAVDGQDGDYDVELLEPITDIVFQEPSQPIAEEILVTLVTEDS